jgi:hypothetical protein
VPGTSADEPLPVGRLARARTDEPPPEPRPREPARFASSGSSPSIVPPSTIPSATGPVAALQAAPATGTTAARSGRRGIAIVGVLSVIALAVGYLELRRDLVGQPPAAHPAQIRVKFVSAPSGATVRVRGSGEVLGVTPFTWTVAASDQPAIVEFAKPGFALQTQILALVGDDAVAVALAPETPAAPAPSAEPPPLPAVAPAPGADAAPAPPGPAAPTAPIHSKPERSRPPRRPAAAPERPADEGREPTSKPPGLDRNGTLDVFKR